MKRIVLTIFLFSIFFLFGCRTVLSGDSSGSRIEAFFNDPSLPNRDTTLQEMILSQINSAVNSIDLVTYNFTDTKSRDALIKANRRGVTVRIVVDEDNGDAAVIHDLQNAGIQVLVARSDGLMHAKFIVIDDDVTISGSANMTAGSFFYDNNYMILVHSTEVNRLFKVEFNEMFEDKLFGSRSPKTEAPDIITLDDGTRLLVRFSPDDSVKEILLSLINASKNNIQVLAYSFSSNDIGNALIKQYDAGLDVSVIFERDKAYKDAGGEAEYLRRAGVPIFMDGSDGLMHEKVFIFDKSIVAAGSYNFTRAADERNDEQILIIDNDHITDEFMHEFETLMIDATQR